MHSGKNLFTAEGIISFSSISVVNDDKFSIIHKLRASLTLKYQKNDFHGATTAETV